MKNILIHWKSTAQGVLSFLLVTAITIQGVLSSFIHPTKMQLAIGVGCNIVMALGKAWIAFLQKDAGTVLATVPGEAVPQAVPAHAVPDDPAAKAVIPKA